MLPEYSGVAAVVPRGQPVEEPAGAQVMGLMEKILAVKAAQQQMAGVKLQSMMDMVKQGFPVDPKQATKLIKQAGLPISTKPEDMMVDVAVDRQTKQGQNAFTGGAGVAGVAASSKKVADDTQKQGQLPKDATPEQKKEFFLNTIAKMSRQKMNMQAMTDQQKAENELHIEQLKSQAMNGDEGAVGKLIVMGVGHFDLNYATWAKMTPEQQHSAAAIAAGAETEAQTAERATRIGDSLLTSGRLNDPTKAYQLGKIYASGGAVPTELQASIKPFSFDDLAKESELANNLVQLGLPANQVGSALHAATVGGLENALPKTIKPIALEGLKLQQQQVGLEQKRVDIEVQRYKQETARLQKLDDMEKNKQLSEENKQTLDMFRAAVESKKAGYEFPKDVMKGLTAKIADMAGMDTEAVDHWYGTTYSFVPRLTPEGGKVVDKAAGEPLKAPSGTTLDSVKRAAKKAGVGIMKDLYDYEQRIDNPKGNPQDRGPEGEGPI